MYGANQIKEFNNNDPTEEFNYSKEQKSVLNFLRLRGFGGNNILDNLEDNVEIKNHQV